MDDIDVYIFAKTCDCLVILLNDMYPSLCPPTLLSFKPYTDICSSKSSHGSYVRIVESRKALTSVEACKSLSRVLDISELGSFIYALSEI